MTIRYPQLADTDWLRRQYVERRRTMRAIGDEVGCTPAAVLHALRRGGIVSRPAQAFKHGYTHGQLPRESPTYRAWQDMLNRCRNPRIAKWRYYGGRGIEVCERWQGDDGFVHFLADMGEKPSGLTLDRVDNDGNYEPANCRWATYSQQNRNKRRRADSP